MKTVITKEDLKEIRDIVLRDQDLLREIRELARAAELQNARRKRAREKRQRKQERREKKLDAILLRVMQGLSAIMELGRSEEIQRLSAGRARVQKETPLFCVGDGNTKVSVCFAEESVKLYISNEVVSPAQRATSPTQYTFCEMTRTYNLSSAEPIKPGGFWRIFHGDFSRYWREEWYEDGDIPADRDTNPQWQVSDDKLYRFENLDLGSAFNTSDSDWWRGGGIVGFVLLRLLADCADYANLTQHLKSALNKMM